MLWQHVEVALVSGHSVVVIARGTTQGGAAEAVASLQRQFGRERIRLAENLPDLRSMRELGAVVAVTSDGTWLDGNRIAGD